MNSRPAISRRRALTTVAGGFAIASGLRGGSTQAWAQAPKRIEQLGPELDMIISTTEPIQELASGFGGESESGTTQTDTPSAARAAAKASNSRSAL